MKQVSNGFYNRTGPLICFVVEFSEPLDSGGVDAPEPSSEELSRQKGLLKQFNTYFCDMCGILCKFSLYIRKCRSFFLFVVLQECTM